MRLRIGLLLLLALFGGARRARAQDLKDRVNFRLGVTGLYLREDEPNENDATRKLVGPVALGYGDLRAVLDARRLPGNFELHLDGRVRLTGGAIQTGSTDFTGTGMSGASGMSQPLTASSTITSRGYLGGREYQINELWARGRWAKLDLGLGRLIVAEADALRLDGARFWVHAHKRWDVSVYGGVYPDPYSRSLDTDYGGVVGVGGLAGGGGLSAQYRYERVFGAFSGDALYLGGTDQTAKLGLNSDGTLQAAGVVSTQDKLRAYLTWNNFWRPNKYLDLYHDLVLDLAGAAGIQLTRLDAFIAGHVNKYLTLRLGYDHMSSLAIERYLSKLLANRTEFLPGTIDNNLTLSRTARDEARLAAEVQINRTTVTGEGRFRRRVLATPSNDPQFLYPNATMTGYGDQVAPTLGWDATLTVRNRGSVWGLRPSFWFTYLSDYRAKDIYVGAAVGRDFWSDRVSIDLGLSFANTHDEQIKGGNVCPPAGLGMGLSQATALQACFGTRSGNNIQPSLTLSINPAKHWFVLLDYRAGIAINSDVTGTSYPVPYVIPYVLTNMILVRVEARY